jgi:septum site-determining protein MinD
LEREKFPSPKLVLNRLRTHLTKNGGMMDVDEVVAVLAINLLGVVPDDERVIRAGNLGEPIAFDNSPAGKAYRNIAKRIQGEMVPLLVLDREVTIVNRMKKWLGFA